MKKQRISIWRPLVLAAFAPVLAAQTPPIRGPVLGFVFDGNAAALRTVQGIPGAATLGKPMDFGMPVERVAVSPNQNYVVLVIKDSHDVYVWDARAQTDPQKLAVPSNPTQILMSPTGAIAGFYYIDSRGLILAAGLPGAPDIRQPISLTSDTAPGPIAIADDGKMAMAGFPDASKVIAFDAGGNQTPINYGGQATAITFMANSYHAVIASTAENGVYRVWDNWEFSLLAGEDQSVAAPVAVNATPDNKRVIVVNSGSATIMEFELDTGNSRTTTCQCTPTNLDRMTGNTVFRLNELSGGPLWILESGPSESRLLFIPPDSQVTGAQ